MNQGETICRGHEKEVSCFETVIPHRFESAGRINSYCSFNFPPGYSIYVEEFILRDFSSNNFILLDGKPLQYSPKLEWSDRRRIFWDARNAQALKENSLRRSIHSCVKSLKVLRYDTEIYFSSLKVMLQTSFRYIKVYSKSVKFAFDIQISPHCEEKSAEEKHQDQLYLGAVIKDILIERYRENHMEY